MWAQIQTSTVQIAPKVSTSQKQPFDSTKNIPFITQLDSYVGQLVYFPGIKDHNLGYRLYYNKQGRRYGSPAPGNGNYTAFEDLYGKYFYVDSIKDNNGSFSSIRPKTIIFKNRDDPDDILQYEMPRDTRLVKDWITVSFYNYIRSFIGQKYYLLEKVFEEFEGHYGMRYCLYPYDIETGNEIELNGSDLWEFIDISENADDQTLIAIFKNQAGQTSYCSIFDLGKTDNGSYKLFPQEEYNRLTKKYGSKYTKMLLNREYGIGMPEELFRLLMGAPSSVNHSSYQDQWVYSGNYFYFQNGKLTAWN